MTAGLAHRMNDLKARKVGHVDLPDIGWPPASASEHAGDMPAIDLSAQTPVLSTVHHPLGSPTGPGLFKVKGLQLPAYVQNIARALQRNGHPESQAIQLAIGAVQRWARGQGKVSPEVRAAAAKAVAAWEAAKATAHSHANENGGDAVELAAPDLDAIALAFSEALHPRVPAGGAGGGEFGSKAAGPAKQAPAKSQQAKQQKPGIGAGRKAALAKQAASLHARAKADRMQAAELESQLQTLNAAIKVKVAASAKAKTAAKSAAAKAGTAKKAAKVTKATNKAKAGKKATATKASLPHMRVRRIVLRSKIHDLRSQARALDKQAAAIKLAGDDGRFLDLAFAEALAERVPSGKREGGQFHARTSLTRHDTPEQRARAVNAMDDRQRAAVRVSTLPPPGYSWDRADRLTVR